MSTQKEHPLLFKSEMIRAILAGNKTQTRRIVKLRPNKRHPEWPVQPLDIIPMKTGPGYVALMTREPEAHGGWIDYPMGVGDRFWVKEKWAHDDANCKNVKCGNIDHIWYYANEEKVVADSFAGDAHWRSSLFMQRWASRITLEILKISVERIQDITVKDVYAEGFLQTLYGAAEVDPIKWYAELWESINLKSGFGWDVNPWVWCIEFKRVGI